MIYFAIREFAINMNDVTPFQYSVSKCKSFSKEPNKVLYLLEYKVLKTVTWSVLTASSQQNISPHYVTLFFNSFKIFLMVS